MQRRTRHAVLAVTSLVLLLATSVTIAFTTDQTASGLQQALGTWRSTEQFEGEARLTFAFRRRGDDIIGWAVMLGQKRKTDTRATLALTFHGVVWDKDRLRFETMLPEDEGIIGWVFRVTGENRAMLSAVSEDGSPLDDDLSWEMTR